MRIGSNIAKLVGRGTTRARFRSTPPCPANPAAALTRRCRSPDCGSTRRPRVLATTHDVSGEYRSIVPEHHQDEEPLRELDRVGHPPSHQRRRRRIEHDEIPFLADDEIA